MRRAIAAIAVLVGLGACAFPPVRNVPEGQDTGALVANCCQTLEVYPTALVNMATPKIDRLTARSRKERLRPPRLLNMLKAQAYIRDHLRPLDILVTSDKGMISTLLQPGYFTHSVVYLGTEPQLRAAGYWSNPALRPYRERIRAGQIYFEAVPGGVGFAEDGIVFDVDSVAVLRPRLTRAQADAAIALLMDQFGKPFDSRLDSRVPDRLYCSELVETAMPGLRLERRPAYGREMVPPDTIAAKALRGDPDLTFIGFVYARRNVAMTGSAASLAATIRRHWPD